MAANDPKGTMPFDPSAWVEAQRRNLEAFTSAGQIVADGMRNVAERQAAMVQDAMHDLWDEMQSLGTGGGKPPQPQDQLERLRSAFDKVVTEFQEMSSVLLKAQAQAMEVLNACAAANMEAFGKLAPDLAAMQKAASNAMQAATAQVSAAVEEMRKRMTALEDETRQAMDSGQTTKPGRGKTR